MKLAGRFGRVNPIRRERPDRSPDTSASLYLDNSPEKTKETK
ncbi:hypothetical protein ACU6XO_19245 [Klebsiella aerogenes]